MSKRTERLCAELKWSNIFLYFFVALGLPILFYIVVLDIGVMWKILAVLIAFFLGGGMLQAKKDIGKELIIEEYKEQQKRKKK
ncbi:hypothetical protein J4226_00255 [Candidatus Pacearchaeota archaeon]|nr:hypothetical protein [Candidatus Pacearchaeota archaeon]